MNSESYLNTLVERYEVALAFQGKAFKNRKAISMGCLASDVVPVLQKAHNDKGGDCDQNSPENHDGTQLPTPAELEEDDDRIVAQSHDGYLIELLQGMES